MNVCFLESKELQPPADDMVVCRSVDFYVDVLRANLVRRPLQATNVRGDDVENMLFQKELLDSASWQVPPEDIGIANISSSGDMRLDHRYYFLLLLLL